MALRFTLRQLEYLVAVGHAGSVTLAAERMNVSAPSISTALAQLEAELGLPLFIRKHTQGMIVTPSGREIIREAISTLAAARTLMSGAQAYQERKILERQINDLERQLLRFTATQNAATNATPIDPTEDDELLLDAADDDSLLLNILDSD